MQWLHHTGRQQLFQDGSGRLGYLNLTSRMPALPHNLSVCVLDLHSLQSRYFRAGVKGLGMTTHHDLRSYAFFMRRGAESRPRDE